MGNPIDSPLRTNDAYTFTSWWILIGPELSRRRNWQPPSDSIGEGELAVAVVWVVAVRVREDPDLQEPKHFGAQIEFAVLDAGPGAHVLHLPTRQRRTVAQTVAVRQLAQNDGGDDLHVLMRMQPKPEPGFDLVVVQHTQLPEVDVVAIVIVGEREMMARVQLPVIEVAHLGVNDVTQHQEVMSPFADHRPNPRITLRAE
jgi:hypothetical protein